MDGFVVLIMFFFSILATILIMIMAGIAMVILLSLFFVIAIIVGVKRQSLFKGLRVFILSSSILIITPLTYIMLKSYSPQIMNLGMGANQIVSIALGIAIGGIFGLVSYKTFEKIATLIYKKIDKRKNKD